MINKLFTVDENNEHYKNYINKVYNNECFHNDQDIDLLENLCDDKVCCINCDKVFTYIPLDDKEFILDTLNNFENIINSIMTHYNSKNMNNKHDKLFNNLIRNYNELYNAYFDILKGTIYYSKE